MLPRSNRTLICSVVFLDIVEFGHDRLQIEPALQDAGHDIGQLAAECLGDSTHAGDQHAALGLRHQRRRSQGTADGFVGARRHGQSEKAEQERDNKPFHQSRHHQNRDGIVPRSCLTIRSPDR